MSDVLQQSQNSGETSQEENVQQQVQHNPTMLEQTLSPITSRYLYSKYQLISDNESLDKIDLRHMCENVGLELRAIQNEAAYDYLKVENEIVELNKQVDQSDSILGELENLLLGFQENLKDINQEMTILQQQSVKMNTSLNNRKNIQNLITQFIDNVVLEPQLVEDICVKDIDDEYIEHIRKLCMKLDYIHKNNLADCKAVRELEPELNKLKNKACARLRAFIIDKLNQLKKPNTNIQIIQNNVLLKYKVFLQFLRDNYIDIFLEICNYYSDLMSKLYNEKFKLYINDINRLIVEVYAKTDTILNDNIQQFRMSINTKQLNLNLPQNTRSIYNLVDREGILVNIDEDPIIPHVAIQRNQKFVIEQIFKSINKLLLDTVASEFIFTIDFFVLKPEQSKVVFSGIFKDTIAIAIENFRFLVSQTNDSFGVILIGLLNDRNKKFFNSKGFTLLDYYFNQVNQIVWPRFEQIFDEHLNSIKYCNIKNFKALERNFNTKLVLLRYIDFALSLYTLYSFAPDNNMLRIRLTSLKNSVIELLKKSAKETQNEHERISYLISNSDFIVNSFIQKTVVFEEDLISFEKELSLVIDSHVELSSKDYFGNLVEFVRTYANEENEHELRKLSQDVNVDIHQQTGNKSNYKKDAASASVKLVENIITEFSDVWIKRIESFKNDCEKEFGGSKSFKQIVKKFLTNIMAYYNTFFKFVREHHPRLVSSMIPLHQVMNQIKTYLNSIN